MWFVGQLVESDFVGGVGLGLVVAALLLRFGRTTVEEAANE